MAQRRMKQTAGNCGELEIKHRRCRGWLQRAAISSLTFLRLDCLSLPPRVEGRQDPARVGAHPFCSPGARGSCQCSLAVTASSTKHGDIWPQCLPSPTVTLQAQGWRHRNSCRGPGGGGSSSSPTPLGPPPWLSGQVLGLVTPRDFHP